LLTGGGEQVAAQLRRRDFAWINRRVGVVGEEGTVFRRPFFFVLRLRAPPKSCLAARQGMERLGDVRGLGAMIVVDFVEDPATRAPSPRRVNRVVAEAEKARGEVASGAPLLRRSSLTVSPPPL
jgi:hypothetical protein